MNIAALVSAIDADIDKLKRARTILSTLITTPQSTTKTAARRPAQTVSAVGSKLDAEAEAAPAIAAQPPSVVLVPPRVKRAYGRRARAQEPRALTATLPAKPVFVPRAVAAPPVERVMAPPAFNPEAMEAAMRQSLLKA